MGGGLPNEVNSSKHVLVMRARMMMSTPAFAIINMSWYWYELVDSLVREEVEFQNVRETLDCEITNYD